MSHELPSLASIRAGRHYVIATDGACRGNPGPSGWGLVKQLKDGSQLLQQAANAAQAEELVSTNNRMELLAAIMAAEGVQEVETPAIIRTDSNYVLEGFTRWLPGWKAKGWRGSDGPVKNADLWERLDAACAAKTIYWEKVKGHSGDKLNEIADKLASNAATGRYPNGRQSVRRRHPDLFLVGGHQ